MSHAFQTIVSIAAECDVDLEVVETVAEAHGDASFAETTRRGRLARAGLVTLAERALVQLALSYKTPMLLMAIRSTQEPPVVAAEGSAIRVGSTVFQTRKGALLVHVWRLRNPGHGVTQSFFNGLVGQQRDVSDPDEFIGVFNESIDARLLAGEMATVRLARDATLDYLNTQSARK